VPAGLYPFVLTGQKIDRNMYDNLNAYTDEAGSDGVVRVGAANMKLRPHSPGAGWGWRAQMLKMSELPGPRLGCCRAGHILATKLASWQRPCR